MISAAVIFPLLNLNSPAAFSQAIIIDHNCTDLSQVPAYWLEQAKQLTLHYAHTSHGSQIISGIENLESLDSCYSVAVRESSSEGLPPEEDPPALRIYDGNPPETYIEPGDYWEGPSAWARTTAVAATGRYDFSMWSWCGQVSSASESYINQYLNTMDQFESWYPGMRFIYMTGHLDIWSYGNLKARNQQIRDYCLASGKVLFDFADIESYDPSGTFYDYATDSCDYYSDSSGGTELGNWADEWCAAYPGSDLCSSCSCAHSKALNCNQKARAFWWMMARLAGWNGQTAGPSPSPSLPAPTPFFNATASGDYDGDGTDDIGLFRPAIGLWSVRGITRIYFGISSDFPVSGDYRGEGTSEIGIFRPSSGLWALRGFTRFYFGGASDLPVPGDYNGDGSCESGVYRSSSGLWSIRGVTRFYYGAGADLPLPGDYEGNGTATAGLYRSSSGLWALRGKSRFYFGGSPDSALPGDFDGDGTCDGGVFRPASGLWSVRGVTRLYFGGQSDYPVPADFNGDGARDIAVFRGASGLWALRGITRAYYGAAVDLPVTR